MPASSHLDAGPADVFALGGLALGAWEQARQLLQPLWSNSASHRKAFHGAEGLITQPPGSRPSSLEVLRAAIRGFGMEISGCWSVTNAIYRVSEAMAPATGEPAESESLARESQHLHVQNKAVQVTGLQQLDRAEQESAVLVLMGTSQLLFPGCATVSIWTLHARLEPRAQQDKYKPSSLLYY